MKNSRGEAKRSDIMLDGENKRKKLLITLYGQNSTTDNWVVMNPLTYLTWYKRIHPRAVAMDVKSSNEPRTVLKQALNMLILVQSWTY